MIITICLLILVYAILGKDVKLLVEKLKNVLWFVLDVLDEGAAILFVRKKLQASMRWN